MAFALLIWKGRLLTTFKNLFTFLRHPVKAHGNQKSEERIYLPYGVAISLGSVWALCTV